MHTNNHIYKSTAPKIGYSSLNIATNIFQTFSDISHNFSRIHLCKLLTNSLPVTHKNTHPRPPSPLTPVHTHTNFWANIHKLSHTHSHNRQRGSLRQWGTWQWEVIEKALERCQCITIISPVDPAEIQAQCTVADTHTHTHSLGGVRTLCVCVCVVDRRWLWASYWRKCVYTDTRTHTLEWSTFTPLGVRLTAAESLKCMCADTWPHVSLNLVPELCCKGKDASQREFFH